jgi:hypothetical protein
MVTGVMSRIFSIPCVLTAVAFAGLLAGCTPGGVGDPCTPEDEYLQEFSGFSVEEVNVESRSFQCETRICLVNHFQGRVSCPYGNADSTIVKAKGENPPGCIIPGDASSPITAAVDPQILTRRAKDAVYCSCRCDGPDANARYCQCPSGFQCTPLVDELGLGKGGQLAGSYCIRERTKYEKGVPTNDVCLYSAAGSKGTGDCGGINPDGTPQ